MEICYRERQSVSAKPCSVVYVRDAEAVPVAVEHEVQLIRRNAAAVVIDGVTTRSPILYETQAGRRTARGVREAV